MRGGGLRVREDEVCRATCGAPRHGRTSTSSFQNAPVSCLRGCGDPVDDSQEPDLACPMFRMWCHRWRPEVQVRGTVATSVLLRWRGLSGHRGVLHVVTLDVARFAVDKRRHGEGDRAARLIAGRVKVAWPTPSYRAHHVLWRRGPVCKSHCWSAVFAPPRRPPPVESSPGPRAAQGERKTPHAVANR